MVQEPFNECKKLILVMDVSTWFFSKTTHKKQLKLCGNCKLAEFGLSEEDASLLTETVAGHGVETIRNSWLREG